MERIQISGLTLEGYAQGGIRTSIAVPEIGAIFDAGEVLPTCLRYDDIFITHAHPDHIGSLTNIVGKRNLQRFGPDKGTKPRNVNVHVPQQILSDLSEIFEIWWRLNGGRGSKWPINIIGHRPNDIVKNIRPNIDIHALKTYHSIDSIGWCAVRKTQKLKEEFIGKSQQEIVDLKKSGIEITRQNEEVLLTIPGDTKIDFLDKEHMAQNARVLVHEVTIWDDESSSVEKTRRYGHTHFREMIKSCEKFNGEYLVLCHRSMKYTRKFIEDVAKKSFPSSMLNKIVFFDGGDFH